MREIKFRIFYFVYGFMLRGFLLGFLFGGPPLGSWWINIGFAALIIGATIVHTAEFKREIKGVVDHG